MPEGMTTREILAQDSIAPEALDHLTTKHADVVVEVKAAIAKSPIVVVGMAQNPHVKRVRKALSEAGFQFTYLEYGSYLSQWGKRLAIKIWSGWRTFPQVFVNGVLLGGADLTQAAIESGKLRELLKSAPSN